MWIDEIVRSIAGLAVLKTEKAKITHKINKQILTTDGPMKQIILSMQIVDPPN